MSIYENVAEFRVVKFQYWNDYYEEHETRYRVEQKQEQKHGSKERWVSEDIRGYISKARAEETMKNAYKASLIKRYGSKEEVVATLGGDYPKIDSLQEIKRLEELPSPEVELNGYTEPLTFEERSKLMEELANCDTNSKRSDLIINMLLNNKVKED